LAVANFKYVAIGDGDPDRASVLSSENFDSTNVVILSHSDFDLIGDMFGSKIGNPSGIFLGVIEWPEPKLNGATVLFNQGYSAVAGSDVVNAPHRHANHKPLLIVERLLKRCGSNGEGDNVIWFIR
jgi:hypothetical protein